MGLDIYAGKLTRYYCRNWENISQQLAEEHGQQCIMVCGGQELRSIEDEAEIQQIKDAVCNWSDGLAAVFNPPLPTPLWNENCDCGYYTDKPDWEAFGALILLQACLSLQLPLPEYIKCGWNAYDDPIVKKAFSQPVDNSLLSNVEVWLPIPDMCIFKSIMPTGNEVTFSTVSLLKHELEEINKQLWNADEATILSWRNDNYYVPVDRKPKLILGFISRTNSKKRESYRTEDLAKCAYSMLWQAVDFASEHRTPILLDY